MLIVKFRGLIDKIIQVLSTIIMGVMVIAVCWQVITRYILNNPSTVTEEALRYLLIWVTMVGGAYAYGRRKHLAITALSKRLSFKGQKIPVMTTCCVPKLLAFSATAWASRSREPRSVCRLTT